MLQIVASLTGNSRDVIYNCNMFILQAYYIFLVTKNGECKQTQQKLDEARGYIGIFLYSGVKHSSLLITECYNAKIIFLM